MSNAPKGNGFTAIAAGGSFGEALKADGSIIAWGLDSGNVVSNPPKGNGFKAIAAGNTFGLALSAAPEPNSLLMAGTAAAIGLIVACWRRRASTKMTGMAPNRRRTLLREPLVSGFREQGSGVILKADVYDRILALADDARAAYPLAMKVVGRDGWDDPQMDEYNDLDPRR